MAVARASEASSGIGRQSRPRSERTMVRTSALVRLAVARDGLLDLEGGVLKTATRRGHGDEDRSTDLSRSRAVFMFWA
jgi:hypothetical protein